MWKENGYFQGNYVRKERNPSTLPSGNAKAGNRTEDGSGVDGELRDIRLPDSFVHRVGVQLGNELPSFLASMNQPPFRGLRMNPFRKGAEYPFRDAVIPIAWEKYGWEIPIDSDAGVTIAHEAGAFYLQEPCAMLPAAVLNAQPEEKILDLCAAPGGKSTQIGIAMEGKGLLVCNEPIPKRAEILSRNLERIGICNAIVTCAYPKQLEERWAEAFDGILVDAPCSGEGMFRRHPESRKEWTPEKAAGCVLRQLEILDSAAKMVRPGGRMVYSTCTWNPEENEENIKRFLDHNPEFELEPFHLPGIAGDEGFFTCWLHRVRGEGQFMAQLRKKGSGKAKIQENRDPFRITRDALQIWEKSGIRTAKPNASFGATLIQLAEIPDLKGIQVLRMGLHLGQIKGSILIPDHAASMGMERPEMPETKLKKEEALKYLAGEAIAGDARGWTLMTWQNYVLGWGKGSDGMIRNHYPKGLRNAKLIG